MNAIARHRHGALETIIDESKLKSSAMSKWL
jgi:hypothetical protein